MQWTTWEPPIVQWRTNALYHWTKALGLSDTEELKTHAAIDVSWFWQQASKRLETRWFKRYKEVVELSQGRRKAGWFYKGKMNAAEQLTNKSKEVMEQTAFIDESGEWTYERLAEEVQEAAGRLRKAGVQKGGRAAVLARVDKQSAVVYMALLYIGAAAAPYNPCWTTAIADEAHAQFQPEWLIVGAGSSTAEAEERFSMESSQIIQLSGEVSSRHKQWETMPAGKKKEKPEKTDGADAALILFGESPGEPVQGYVLSHTSLFIKSGTEIGLVWDIRPGDRVWWLAREWGFEQLFAMVGTLANNGQYGLFSWDDKSTDAGSTIEAYGITHIGVDSLSAQTASSQTQSKWKEYHLHSLRYVLTWEADWMRRDLQWVMDVLTRGRIPLLKAFGGAHASGMIIADLPDRRVHPEKYNSRLPGMVMDTWDSEGYAVRHTPGRVVVKKPWPNSLEVMVDGQVQYDSSPWSLWKDVWADDGFLIADGEWYTYAGEYSDINKVEQQNVSLLPLEKWLEGMDSVETALLRWSGGSAEAVIAPAEGWSGTIGWKQDLSERWLEAQKFPLKSIQIVSIPPDNVNKRIWRSAFKRGKFIIEREEFIFIEEK
ncbi:AMP-binding protein [Marinococcus luteus]|uniref:AMP-binding protein n=1 Tax=Marinococcus luteus TaxID=1122204 RepID=UPI002ACD106C|nr:AMP-binding protein [Marinococcus luteus]MDZ5782845.1 AMP-binding protein [Marinococcus luteus]